MTILKKAACETLNLLLNIYMALCSMFKKLYTVYNTKKKKISKINGLTEFILV